MSFVHLHLHSEGSITDGLLRIPDLIENAIRKDFKAIALTDLNNIFVVAKFYREAIKKGIKPIIGCEVSLDIQANEDVKCTIILLCMNQIGYHNLTQLLTKAYRYADCDGPKISYASLQEHHQGLLVLSGGIRSDLAYYLIKNQLHKAIEVANFWKQHFPNRYYVEIFRTERSNENIYSNLALKFARDYELPVVATNDVCFLEQDLFDMHEVKVCITNGEILNDDSRIRHHSLQQYLKTSEQMQELFQDVPEATENSVEIAKRCTLEIEMGQILLPDFSTPTGTTVEQYLREQVSHGLSQRLGSEINQEYEKRLEHELNVITKMQYGGYFLIVADFVRWAKEQSIPVGPGRGSGAGSLVAYVLGITEINPLRYDLLFERFLNPERVSMPDFDIDFCMERRDRVIEYVTERYGHDKVSQIITFGRMAAKAVVRDVGRVRNNSYNFVDEIARLIPDDLNITLSEALKKSPELNERYKNEPEVASIIDTGMQLEGLIRHAGKHAGGVVIAPKSLTNYTALYYEAGEKNAITQFDMNDIEKIGLIKFDFLGLKTLTVIDYTIRNLYKLTQNEVVLENIPLDDKPTYKLLQQAKTKSIFQMESEGMRALLRDMEPDKFEDIIALVALYRPGPLQSGMAEAYVKCKHGAAVRYVHPALETILKPTYGTILYQEQVMQAAQILAGYSLGSADILRRAMGKKLPQEMAGQREKFCTGAQKNGVNRATAMGIFDDIEKFAGYGFNKSHSVAYALIAYQTAWLKTHYPAAFMAAVLSTEMRFTEKVVDSIYECSDIGLTIKQPDINSSLWKFEALDDKTIAYGLGAIRNIGSGIINSIVDERKQGGIFSSLQNFCMRMMPQQLKRNTLSALITSGAMDFLGQTRASMIANYEKVYALADKKLQDSLSGQSGMFTEEAEDDKAFGMQNESEVSQHQVMLQEKNTLGFYLTQHPMEQQREEIMCIVGSNMKNPEQYNEGTIRWFAGVIVGLTKRRAKGGFGAFFVLDDSKERIEFKLFGSSYHRHKDILGSHGILCIQAKLQKDSMRKLMRWRVMDILSLTEAQMELAKVVTVNINLDAVNNDFIEMVKQSLKPFIAVDGCPIQLSVFNDKASANLTLGKDWKIKPDVRVLDKLKTIKGIKHIQLAY